MTNKVPVLSLACLLLGCLPTRPLYSQTRDSGYVFIARGQIERIVKQPNGPFAIMLFYEHALADQCGVIYFDIMGIPLNGKWSLSDRFWQDPIWASDVTGFAWSPSGKYLYVSTSEIYGDGGLFRLDLLNKKSDKVFPTGVEPFYDLLEKDGYITQIQSIDFAKGLLHFGVETVNTDKPMEKSLTIKLE